MTNISKLFTGLLVLGMVLIGIGIWLIYDSTTKNISEDNPVTKVNIPEGEPVIYEQVHYLMRGENHEIYIYDDGEIIYIEEKGLRLPTPENPATRTWKTGELTLEKMSALISFIENSDLYKLLDQYNFPGEPKENGGIDMSDLAFTFIVSSDNLSKKVTTFGYLSPDSGETYPDMPSPLSEIYQKLNDIAKNQTKEIALENIATS